MSAAEQEGAPFTDPGDGRLLSPEWDMLFGIMVGRLLANGYTPAQIQSKTRAVADGVRDCLRSADGAQAAEDIQQGLGTMLDKISEGEDGV